MCRGICPSGRRRPRDGRARRRTRGISTERRPRRARASPTRGFGGHVREGRRGKPGHDSPYLMVAGVPGFGFRYGEVWGVHVAWSGNQRYLVEQLPEGAGVHAAVLGGGELLRPGEIALGS